MEDQKKQKCRASGPLTGFVLAAAIIISDQLSKWAVMEHILRPFDGGTGMTLTGWLMDAPGRLPFIRIDVLPFFNWVMVWNKGVSFGLLQTDSPYGPALMIGLALVICTVFAVWLFRTERMFIIVSIGLVIGGAVGNIIDRVRFGAVADFVDLHAFGYHWPAFNLADAAICAGIAFIVIDGLFFDKSHDNAREGERQT
jgi:signal peptidase II